MVSAESLLSGGAGSLGGSEGPLYRKIYECFCRAVANGTYGLVNPSRKANVGQLDFSTLMCGPLDASKHEVTQ